MPVDVWWGSGSGPAWRVLMGLSVKGVPYTSHLLSFSAGDTQSPAFLALNPRGQVPVIRDGDFVLNESLAILSWLDDKHPEPPLFGRNAEDRGRVWRAIFEHENHAATPFRNVQRPIFGGRAESDAEEIRKALVLVHQELGRLEAALEGGYVVGDALSAADIVWFCAIAAMIRAATRPAAAGLDLGIWPLGERYPQIAGWAAKIEAIPGFTDTVPPHWKEGDNPFPSLSR